MSSQKARETSDAALHALISRVAEIRGTEPTELPPLQTAIDTDALRALMDGFAGECEFTYAGCDVTVRGDGTIHVSERRADSQ